MTNFETNPDRYAHWKLTFDGAVARLAMNVQEDKPFRDGYRLKLNSYDLGVDIELCDAIERIRFEHPEVNVVVLTSENPRIFCAGANIQMLGSSSHPFKVNFCKYTNETRCSIENASAHSGIKFIAALNGTASGGGYEVAAACDEIYLVDDGNSAVSLPEVPLLGVLPGTGGLTRLVDKRKIRRDLADVFATKAEGLKAKRAKEWGLIDGYFSRSRFDEGIKKRAAELAARPKILNKTGAKGIVLTPIAPSVNADASELKYKHVTLKIDRAQRLAELTIFGPAEMPSTDPAVMRELGAEFWPFRAYREVNDALCRLRHDEETVGLVLLKTRGKIEHLLAGSRALAANRNDWFANEIILFLGRMLRRLDVTGKSFFSIIDEDSACAGSLLEVALAADRIYMKNDAGGKTQLAIGPLSTGLLPMSNGLTRLQSRFLKNPEHAESLAKSLPRMKTSEALAAGLVTFAPDELDWSDEIRLAIEERLSLSPDALTGMEASLRFGGPEAHDSKIYGRLSAWQNWIFTRPNATGKEGALVLFGQPERPKFDWRRT
ncbi:MAG: benzoyl-CoA-dihydrodiol lyase [Planctomycetes bacterium]|nr:benzoyl-CoA-dihydrodiol lyase [Planctomycetota bacterium]